MDPEDIRKLIEGQPDVLALEAQEEAKLYKDTMCPMCFQSGCEKIIPPPKIVEGPDGPSIIQSPFVDGKSLPQGYAHCIHCGTDFNPRTGMIMKTEASMIHGPQLDLLLE